MCVVMCKAEIPHEMFFLFWLVHEHTFIAGPCSDQKGANIS